MTPSSPSCPSHPSLEDQQVLHSSVTEAEHARMTRLDNVLTCVGNCERSSSVTQDMTSFSRWRPGPMESLCANCGRQPRVIPKSPPKAGAGRGGSHNRLVPIFDQILRFNVFVQLLTQNFFQDRYRFFPSTSISVGLPNKPFIRRW